MLASSDFSLLACQAALFTPRGGVSMRVVLNELLPLWKQQFDGEPQFYPVQSLPPELPFAKLQSESQEWRCDLSNRRADIHWQMARDDSTIDLGEFFSRSAQLLLTYRSVCDRQVGRVAAVVKRYATVDDPGLVLARHFCKERWDKAPLNRPGEFQLHAHKRFRLADFDVNSWVRSKAATLSIAGQSDRPIALVEQDINTVADDAETHHISDDRCRQFFSLVSEEHECILRLYYPING